jgi:hypothetical protein
MGYRYTDEHGCERYAGDDDAEILEAFKSPVVRLDVAPSNRDDPPRSVFELSSMDNFVLANGWKVRVFWDCGDWDYIDEVEAPDGRVWEWGLTQDEVANLRFGCPVFNEILDVEALFAKLGIRPR